MLVQYIRKAVVLALAAGAVGMGAPVQAQAPGAAGYPSRPIQWLVPWAPGGGADILARLLAPHLAQELGQPVVIDNRPGAGGNIGAAQAAQAAPDGYTVLFATAATHAINPGLYSSLRFKPEDFEAVTQLVTITNVLVVHPELPARSVAELIELSRRQPLYYASAGNGSTQHLAAEMFKGQSGIEMTHVPYKGGGPAVTATMSGDTQVLFADPLAALPFVQSGRLVPIAVTSLARLDSLPELPTVAESGLPGFEAINWSGVMVPAGTPPAVVETLRQAVHRVLARPEVKARLTEQGYVPSPSGGPAFARLVADETARWGEVIRAAGVKVD